MSRLPASEEHHVPAHLLEPVGAGKARGEVDRRGLEQDVLRSDVQRGIGRSQLDRELGKAPVAIVATGGAEHLPERRQVGRVGVHASW